MQAPVAVEVVEAGDNVARDRAGWLEEDVTASEVGWLDEDVTASEVESLAVALHEDAAAERLAAMAWPRPHPTDALALIVRPALMQMSTPANGLMPVR